MQNLSRKANRQRATRRRRRPSPRKRRREHPRLRENIHCLAVNPAPQPRLRRPGTLEAGAVVGRRVLKREHRRSKKTRERTLTIPLLQRRLGIQVTGIGFQALTGVAIDLSHAIDEMLTRPRYQEKGGIPGVTVVAAAIAILGGRGAGQFDQSADADQGVDLSGEMTGGELEALRVLGVTTTHLTEDRDHRAGGVLIEQIAATHQDLLDGGGRDLTPV